MRTCPYCASELKILDATFYRCEFCRMTLHSDDTQEDGCRKPVSEEYAPPDAWLSCSTPEMMTFSTVQLIFLLRYARSKRASSYNYVRVFNKAGDAKPSLLQEYHESVQATGEAYEYWTRKAWVIENILRERTGNFPAKITDRYLAELLVRIQEINAKPMEISRNRRRS